MRLRSWTHVKLLALLLLVGGPPVSETETGEESDGGCQPEMEASDAGATADDEENTREIAATKKAQPVKGIWLWSSTARGHESTVLAWLVKHHYTDVFVLVKGTSGKPAFDVLAKLLSLKEEKGYTVRVWPWIIGFRDSSHASSSWTYLVGDWVSPDSASYRKHLVDIADQAINPDRGKISSPPDGLMLDEHFQWPSQRYGSSTSHRVSSLMATLDAIRAKVKATREAYDHKILLGVAPHPEANLYKKVDGKTLSYAAYAYGQDFGELAVRCDWIMPETYRYGHYDEPITWIGKTVSAITREIAAEQPKRSSVVRVLPALVLYKSDSDATAISATDLAADKAAALKVASGYSVFRYATRTVNPGTLNDGGDWPTAEQNQVLDE